MTWLLRVLVCGHEVLREVNRHCSRVYDMCVCVCETNEHVTVSVLSGPGKMKRPWG